MTLAVCSAMLLGAPVASTSAADLGFGDEVRDKHLSQAVSFLQKAQNADGGLPAKRGGGSDPGTSAWAALAVAAGGVSPRDQTVRGGTTLWRYLTDAAPKLTATEDLARLALVAKAAKSTPEKVGSVRPLAAIIERQAADGSIASASGAAATVASTAWAVLALPAGDARTRARTWLAAQRAADGGWPEAPGGAGDGRTTGVVMQALGRTAGDDRAAGFLQGLQQGRTGGIARTAGAGPDPLTTAMVVQGMTASAANESLLSYGSYDPTQYLWNRQSSGGGLGSILATAQVGGALAEQPFPLAGVASKGPTNTGTPADGGTDTGTDDETTTTSTDAGPNPFAEKGGPLPSSIGGDDGGDDAVTAGSGPEGDVATSDVPAADVATSEPLPADLQAAAEAAPKAKPKSETKADAPAPSADNGVISGTVVGATTAGPSGAAKAAGATSSDSDRAAMVLGGAMLVAVIFGAWVERRPRRASGSLT